MIDPKDLTILVQGKLHKHTLSRVQKYRQWGQIVIGCDTTEDKTELEQYDLTGCRIVDIDIPIADTTMNNFRMYLQCKSIYEGLKHVTTPFAMKVRCDYWVANLEPFIQRMSEYPEKFVTTNLYFRADSARKYHPSDHVVGGKTEDMLKGYEICCYRLENHSKELREAFNDERYLSNDKWLYYPGKPGTTVPNASELMTPGMGISPEMLIGTSLVTAKGYIPTLEDSRDIMTKCFEIVKTETMTPYLSKYNSSVIPHDSWGIHDIKDL